MTHTWNFFFYKHLRTWDSIINEPTVVGSHGLGNDPRSRWREKTGLLGIGLIM